MPRTTRQELLRLQEQASNDLERALWNIKQMHDLYFEPHPDYAETCATFASFIVEIQSKWNEFRHTSM